MIRVDVLEAVVSILLLNMRWGERMEKLTPHPSAGTADGASDSTHQVTARAHITARCSSESPAGESTIDQQRYGVSSESTGAQYIANSDR